ncbi:VanZ family protein [Nocardioides sp. CER19]|uniref:VanZ family protein n=1 Tax=Nocardioides sp. CER19 TaxID=3038538 RepID=UPI00244B8AC3|nr:VanZ family protein [Nocardioides sp. CER19]MDH2413152.1 VanZ family protein [Nocardioides sp. CER19]
MFPFGGVSIMLLGAVVSGVALATAALVATRRLGWRAAWATAALLWSLTVIGLVTLIPAYGAPGIVPAEGRLETCSWDIGGPAPQGFWIFASGQRLLNTLLFVPSGVLLVVVATRWRHAWITIPLGLVVLAAYSAGIEWTQLVLARIDRACDVTDLIENATGAVIGVLLGLLLLAARRLMRPTRRRDLLR